MNPSLATATGVCAALLAWASVGADQQNYRMSTDDLAIQVNGEWSGGGQGGYYPLRIRVVNTGPTRQLTFRFKPDPRQRLPRVERTIQATQNARQEFSLAIPLVGQGNRGVLEVADENGKAIESLEQPIRFPQVDAGFPAPAVLVISNGRVSTRALGRAAVRLATAQGLGSPRYGAEIGVEGVHVSPAALPTAWRDYTCIDLAFIDLVTLGDLRKDARRALLRWVNCGGTLVLYNVGTPPAESKELQTLLEFDSVSPASGHWTEAANAPRERSKNHLIRTPAAEQLIGRRGRPGRPVRRVVRSRPRVEYRWPSGRTPFFQRDVMFGRIVVFAGDPFRGTEYDWAWFLMSVGSDRYRWTARHGLSARRESPDFRKFLIPGVKGVPVYSFLFLITAFTVLIGPVNYLLLWKRKRLFLLVMTIPVIAFGTSLALFGYSVISNGFDVKTRVRSLTILDQKSQEAVSMSRVAMFSGLPPSGGLSFQNDTAVYPLWPYEREFEAAAVDWTDGQQLTSGWLRSRTRTQFVTVNRRRERGRLQIEARRSDGLPVSNGFEWKVKAVLVADRKGRLHYGEDLKPGDTVTLTGADGPELRSFDAVLARFTLDTEDTGETRRRRSIFGFRRRPRRRAHYPIHYGGNLMERRLSAFRQIRHKAFRLPPGSYLAVFEQSPGLDLGVDEPTEFAGYHLLLGYY